MVKINKFILLKFKLQYKHYCYDIIKMIYI